MNLFKKIIAAVVFSALLFTSASDAYAADNDAIVNKAKVKAEKIREKSKKAIDKMNAQHEARTELEKANGEAKAEKETTQGSNTTEEARQKADNSIEQMNIKSKYELEKSKIEHEEKMEKMYLDREKKLLKREQKEEKAKLKAKWDSEDALLDEMLSENNRYFIISKDKSFTYYMDTENSRWMRCPYKASEYIIDVWVKLVENSEIEAVRNEESKELSKYYMEHYYLRPNSEQLQFISEMEVSNGRPNNDIMERKYSPSKWERLIPGSIEDSIYKGVMRNVIKHDMLKGKESKTSRPIDRFHTIASSVAEALGIYI